nr:hypothetical protein [Tanacetum cinerariifolium]
MVIIESGNDLKYRIVTPFEIEHRAYWALKKLQHRSYRCWCLSLKIWKITMYAQKDSSTAAMHFSMPREIHEKELILDPGAFTVTTNALFQADGVEVHNPDNMDNKMINQGVQVKPSSEQLSIVNHSETEITIDSNIIPYSQYVTKSQQTAVKNSNSSAEQDVLILSVIEPLKSQKAQQLEPKLYDGNVIKNTSAILIPDSEETLMLVEESRSKILLKQQDPMMLEKKVITTPVDYAALN